MSEPLEVLASCLSRLQDASSSSGGGSTFTGLFPKIICVGSQSAGKSSIIETIVGHSFLPRGGDMVTRCPLHVRLHQTRETDTVRIVFAQDQKYNLEETEFDQFSEVSGEIERRTEKRVGTLKNVRSVSSVRGAESHQSKFLVETRFCWTSSLPSIRTFSLLTCQASPELKWTVRTRTLLRRYLTSTSST